MKSFRSMTAVAACCALAFGVSACGGDDGEETASDTGGQTQEQAGQDLSGLSGSFRIDGSSTVQPFAQAAAELFNEEASNVKITVGGAGTGDGFERFCRGEIQISDASRAIEDDEKQACEKEGIEYGEIQVANDGVAVVTSPDTEIPNDCITTDQLKQLLEPKSKVANLSELGEGFPSQKTTFFTPGEESGTFDFFTEAVLETDAEQRTKNVQTSANDNQLVQGVEGTEGAIGYFGFSFAEQNKEKLKILQVDAGEGCKEPTLETIQNGEYKPLSRPLFMYPSADAMQKPEVKAFMEFVNTQYQQIAEAAQIVPLTEEQASEAKQELDQLGQGQAGGTSTTEGETTE